MKTLRREHEIRQTEGQTNGQTLRSNHNTLSSNIQVEIVFKSPKVSDPFEQLKDSDRYYI